jgi:hypothetical protein
MRQRVACHLTLIFALLFAQQAGFVHALSHFAQAPAQASVAGLNTNAPAQAPEPENPRHQFQACAQCLAVTLADGAVNSHSHIVAVAAVAPPALIAPRLRITQHTAAPFLARAPPSLL